MRTNLIFSVITFFILVGCTAPKEEKESSKEEAIKIEMVKAPSSPGYANSGLEINTMEITKTDSGFYGNFDFEVTNYELGIQTEDANSRGIANSGKGQHIHFILDNGPYSAHYESSFTKKLDTGMHVFLAFLSRSYHESVKNSDAFVVQVLPVGVESQSDFDYDAPHLFYSRPKGVYSGDDTKKLMVDFYLLNTTVSENGNKVRATINDNVFLISEWAPFYVTGLDKGEVTIKLELLDSNGNLIPGPFNEVERKVTLN